MSRINSFGHYCIVFAVLFGVTLAAPSLSGQAAGKKSPQPASPKDAARGPYTLTGLLDLLDQLKQDIETEGRVLRLVEGRGVDFPLTPENQQRLAQAGASTRLMDLVREKAPAPPPLPSPPPPTPREDPKGILSLRCEPVECEVSVQGGHGISTTNGAVTVSGVKVGEAIVDFKKPGYYGQQQTAVVRAGVETSLAAKLEPDNPTQAEFGKRLFAAMQQAVGGGEIHKDLASFSASGSAAFFDASGNTSEWNLSAAFRPGQSTLEVKSAAGNVKLDCRGETCLANSGKNLIFKGMKREQALAVETNLRQFRTWQFAALADRLLADRIRPIAKTGDVPAVGDQELRLEGGNETYTVTLDMRFLPSIVIFESKSGVGSGLTLAFSDYTRIGKSQYPRTTEVKLPEGKQGLRIRLGAITGQPATR